MHRMWFPVSLLLALTAASSSRISRLVSVSGVKDFVMPTIVATPPSDPLDCTRYITHILNDIVIRPKKFDYAVACIAFYLSRAPDINIEFSDFKAVAKYFAHALKGKTRTFGKSRPVIGGTQGNNIWTSAAKYTAVRLAILEGRTDSLSDPLQWTYLAWCLLPRIGSKKEANLIRNLIMREQACEAHFTTDRLDKYRQILTSGEPVARIEYPNKWKIKLGS